MNQIMIPTEQHVHVDLDLDAQQMLHYRSRGEDARRLVLHRGDTVTFSCSDLFSLRFIRWSPVEGLIPGDQRPLVTAKVKGDAAYGIYEYAVRILKQGQLFTDPVSDRRDAPQLIIQAAP
jgi:hypothetical protein